ncbi:hypothetical protein BLL42_24590 [Pseudomonas frederiksbergensis]|uniref:Uncharacterized protein n=1 Tax=Pseudomonas frederiksbergensis TaxID=104087 RepID=A0A1J0ERF3_9PSED|nr:hypothetical protein BLL42_24590 [Pseudomonas frederiksbergensis]
MKCLICQAAARTVHALGDWSEVKCPAGCGHFRVSANLVAKMTLKHESFDLERTRRWLEMARNDEPVPLISTYDYNVSLLHRDAEERTAGLPNRSRQSVTSD